MATSPARHAAQYDYIIHDVFTGGAEPAALFTGEFLAQLSDLLAPTGTIAINYAGDLVLPGAKMVVATVLATFPHCRLFRETPAPSAEEVAQSGDLMNLVIFCRKEGPFGFVEPEERDFWGTQARRNFLMPKYEVDRDMFGQGPEGESVRLLMRGNVGELDAHQAEGRRRHWGLMDLVIPATVWETW